MTNPDSIELPRDSELRDRLIAWCDINSGSDNPAGLDQVRHVLADAFASLPCKVSDVDLGDGNPRALRAVCRPAAKIQVLLNAHFDTVYGPEHAFQKCELVERGTLRGPGVIDDKGGILVMLATLQAFERTPHASRVGWEVILGPDEETGSAASAPLYAEAAPRFHFGMVFEPARENGDLVRARKGTGIFTATCRGRAAHAGRDPSAGRNAILALAEFLLAVARIPEALPDVMVNIGAIRGGGALNIVPDLATAGINARISSAADGHRFEEQLAAHAATINARDGYRLEITGQFNRGPLEVTPAREALFDAYRETARALSLNFGWQDVGGGSDGNLLAAAGLPCLDGIGAHGDGMHSDREWVRISSIAERARLAALFLARIAAGEIALPQEIISRSLARS
ncbi:MAG TPA: hydrolase [Opitutaceae bacterium]|nr:hydrolase [Opitutaceae bacterium]